MANKDKSAKTKKKKGADKAAGDSTNLKADSAVGMKNMMTMDDSIVRRRRENTSDRAFRLSKYAKRIDYSLLDEHVMWFPWQQAIIPSRSGKHKPDWTRRKKGPGFCRRKLYWSFRTQRAIYEVGVQVPDRQRIYTVYYKGCFCGMSTTIYKFMLSDPKIVEEINDIIYRKGTIYIRRGVFTTTNGALFRMSMKYIKTFFSYAWKSKVRQTGYHRLVRKRNFQISGPPIRRRRSRKGAKSDEEPSTTAVEHLPEKIIKDQNQVRESVQRSSSEKDNGSGEGLKSNPVQSADETEDVKPVSKDIVNENETVEYVKEGNAHENEAVKPALEIAVNETEYSKSDSAYPLNDEKDVTYSPEEENVKNERLEYSTEKLDIETPSAVNFSSEESSVSEEYDNAARENKSREYPQEENVDNQQAETPNQQESLDKIEVQSIDFDSKPTPLQSRLVSSNPEQFVLDEKESTQTRNTF